MSIAIISVAISISMTVFYNVTSSSSSKLFDSQLSGKIDEIKNEVFKENEDKIKNEVVSYNGFEIEKIIEEVDSPLCLLNIKVYKNKREFFSRRYFFIKNNE